MQGRSLKKIIFWRAWCAFCVLIMPHFCMQISRLLFILLNASTSEILPPKNHQKIPSQIWIKISLGKGSKRESGEVGEEIRRHCEKQIMNFGTYNIVNFRSITHIFAGGSSPQRLTAHTCNQRELVTSDLRLWPICISVLPASPFRKLELRYWQIKPLCQSSINLSSNHMQKWGNKRRMHSERLWKWHTF